MAKKILDLEFVEISEISLDDHPPHIPRQPPLPACPPVHNISLWVEKYAVMAALLSSCFPEKAPELFAYLGSIVRAERIFSNRRWVAYDRCYRREALAGKSLELLVPNARLYEAFAGHACDLPHSFCLQEDHVTQACPRNPNRPWFGWFPTPGPLQGNASRWSPTRLPQSAECCRRYNDGKCKMASHTCRYSHHCINYGGPHPRLQCPRGGRAPLAGPARQSASPSS